MNQPLPDITIGIPTRNGGALLSRLLARVVAQETPRRFEVLALDSGSTDASLDVIRAHPVRLLQIAQDNFDWGRMRERLFEEARGSIVVNLSQDAVPARTDWLERLIAPLSDPAVGVSCGSSIPDPERPFAQFQWERNGYYYFTREIAKFTRRYGKGLSFANTAVRRSVWEALRIDPQATGEDFGFQMKLHAAGVPIAFPDDAPVLHHHNYTLRGVYRRCRNEGLALRQMGCAYHEMDLVRDLLSTRKYIQWLREVKRGSLRSAAEWVYPVLRPAAVYHGSRFARKMVWY
ncbi:MAG: glycosyltransferase family 2 protein [Candidatus Hydrogenedentes bacterium]|nr:glycosyltransferase family 2 protein [Candidatus Hydrogenedentota bacterium]